jgi:hypothetical protein
MLKIPIIIIIIVIIITEVVIKFNAVLITEIIKIAIL